MALGSCDVEVGKSEFAEEKAVGRTHLTRRRIFSSEGKVGLSRNIFITPD
jgi:hypothetical protein